MSDQIQCLASAVNNSKTATRQSETARWTHQPSARGGHFGQIRAQGGAHVQFEATWAEYPILDDRQRIEQKDIAFLVSALLELLATVPMGLFTVNEAFAWNINATNEVKAVCDE